MEWLIALKDYVPLFQTIVWALLIILGLSFFRKPLGKLFESIQKRLEGSAGGGSVEVTAGIFSLKLGELRELPYFKPTTGLITDQSATTKENKISRKWAEARYEIYNRNRDIFLVHVLEPSKIPHQKYDIFIFLVQHDGLLKDQGVDSSREIEYAEFFLGESWGDQTFKVHQEDGHPLGLSTSAYGPFLVTCRVVFKDGYEVLLDRYIDFEMGEKLLVR